AVGQGAEFADPPPPAPSPPKGPDRAGQDCGLYACGIDYLDVADHLWPVLVPLMRGHAAIYRATGGRIGGRLPGLPPMLFLDHVGAKSRQRRTTPLPDLPDGDNLLL